MYTEYVKLLIERKLYKIIIQARKIKDQIRTYSLQNVPDVNLQQIFSVLKSQVEAELNIHFQGKER